ncbi:MAG: GxxExxY protein [Lacipirellulaceae bacterium]
MEEPDPAVDDLASQTIGAAIEVHKHLGAGFLESVYQQALAIEFRRRGISFQREAPIALQYKGEPVGEARLDFLVGNELIVELKAVESFHPIHEAQVIHYLRATSKQLGLLINFNTTRLKDGGIKRIVYTT